MFWWPLVIVFLSNMAVSISKWLHNSWHTSWSNRIKLTSRLWILMTLLPRIQSLAWCSCSSVWYRQDKLWGTIFNRRQIWCDQAKFQLSLWHSVNCNHVLLVCWSMPVQKHFASWCWKENYDCNKNIWVSIQIPRKFQRMIFVILLIL